MLHLKRIYDPPSPEDGERYLVERLWPRGLTRDAARLTGWLKEVAPSADHAHSAPWASWQDGHFDHNLRVLAAG